MIVRLKVPGQSSRVACAMVFLRFLVSYRGVYSLFLRVNWAAKGGTGAEHSQDQNKSGFDYCFKAYQYLAYRF